MLKNWSEFIKLVDPDIFTGYNIVNFDFPYLLDRADHLGIRTFSLLGRIKGVHSKYKSTSFSS
jgi:DNA polymerase delta subunit 1